MKPRILIFAGPSGGHLFPAVAYAEQIRKDFPESVLYLISSQKAERFISKIPPNLFEKIILWKNFPAPSGLSLSRGVFLIRLLAAFLKSIGWILRFRPNLGVGFGSYVTFPGILASRCLGVPTLIHEQNAVSGKATRWSAPFADKICVSFDKTRGLEKYPHKTHVSGLPVRSFLIEGVKHQSNPENRDSLADELNRLRILVVGGSQGASKLNQTFLSVFSLLSPEEKKQIAVTHITGVKEFDEVREFYRTSEIEHEVHPFFDRMDECLSRADFAMTRAGANTLFELALYGVPAVVIPYPFAGAHQRNNADYFALNGGVICIAEDELNREILAKHIRSFQKDPELRQRMSSSINQLYRSNAAGQIVAVSIDLMQRKKRA